VINTVMQSSVSHDPSEISIILLFAAQETFLISIISRIWLCGKCVFFFRIIWSTKFD